MATYLALLASALILGFQGNETALPEVIAPAPIPTGPTMLVVRTRAGHPVSWAQARVRGGRWQNADTQGRIRLRSSAQVVRASGFFSRRSLTGLRGRITLRARPLAPTQWGGGARRTHYYPVIGALPVGPPHWERHLSQLLEFPPALTRARVALHAHRGDLVMMSRHSGEILWQRKLGRASATTPAFAGNVIIGVSMDGQVGARRVSDGSRKWHRRLPGRSESSPLVVGNRVYLGDYSGQVMAMTTTSGRVRWRTQLGAIIKAGLAASGNTLIAVDYAGCVHALRRDTGARRWVRCFPGGRFYATPSIGRGLVVAASYDGWTRALSLGSGRVRWQFRSTPQARVTAAAAMADNQVIVADDQGYAHSLQLESGTVLWRYRDPLRPVPGRFTGAPAIVGDRVYLARLFRPDEPKLTVVLNRQDGRLLESFPDGRYTPAVADQDGIVMIGHTSLRSWPRSLVPGAPRHTSNAQSQSARVPAP